MNTCEMLARRGTGIGMCGRPLDGHGQCDRARQHIEPPARPAPRDSQYDAAEEPELADEEADRVERDLTKEW
jgi:hypothetical protein